VNLVGGICHLTFLGNTHVAPSVTSCGFDPSSAEGKTFSVLKISCTDNVVTVTASEAHDLIQGQAAVLSGLIDPSFEAPPVTITVCSSTGTWKMRTVLKSWEPWPEIRAWYTNICAFDNNLHAVHPDRGTILTLRGGHFSEWPNQIGLLGTDDARTRWYLRDDPQSPNPYSTIARSQFRW